MKTELGVSVARVFRGSPLAPDPVCGSEFVKPISFRDHGRMAAS